MPLLSGTVTNAVPGAHGFDCTAVVSDAAAKAMRAAGFLFCIRYLSRLSPQSGGDLSNAEANAILSGGLSLMAVQHVERSGWVPSQALGTQYGQSAVANAQTVGIPTGVNLWLDLEGIRPGVPAEDVIQYCNTWFDQVAGAGYAPGVYVGANCILSGDELFWRLKNKHYWRSGSHVPDLPQRGYQLVQRISASPDTMHGLSIDRDMTLTDALGSTAIWLSP